MPKLEIEVSQLVMDVLDEIRNREISDRAAADAIGVSHQTIGNWRRGVRPTVDADTVAGLSRFLQITPLEVFVRLGWLEKVADPNVIPSEHLRGEIGELGPKLRRATPQQLPGAA